jgi:hypothetical protein
MEYVLCNGPKSNIKIVERDKIDTPNTQIHDPTPSWVGTGASVKSDGAKVHISHVTYSVHTWNMSCVMGDQTRLRWIYRFSVSSHTDFLAAFPSEGSAPLILEHATFFL